MAKRRKTKSYSRKSTKSRRQVAQRQAIARKTARPAANAGAGTQEMQATWNSSAKMAAQSAENVAKQAASQVVEQSTENVELFLQSPSIVSDGVVAFSRRLLELTHEQMDQNLRRTQRMFNARSPQEWAAALLRNNVEISTQSARRLSELWIQTVVDSVNAARVVDRRSSQNSNKL